MSGKTNLIDLAGLLTAEEVDIVEKNIKQARKEYNKRVDRIKKLVVESY